MEKEFVTYDQALDLKELGFDEPCLTCYDKLEMIASNSRNVFDYKNYNKSGYMVSRPTFSQAFRWFRDKHNLVFNFINFNIVKPVDYHWSITWNDEAKASSIVKTYEEAEQECLNKLIEIIKNK